MRRRRGDDRGAGTLEYIGSIAVAAVVVATVGLGASNAKPESALARAVCQILTAGLGSCGSAPAVDAKRLPTQPCVVRADGSTATLRAGVVAFGQGSERWLIEELGDGRYRLTRATHVGAGGGTGAGFELTGTWNDNDYGFSLGAEANAFGVEEHGETYYVQSKDEAERFLSERRADQVLDNTVGDSGLVRRFADKVRGGKRLPEPDETWTALGAMGDAKATVDWIAAGAQAEVKGAQMLGTRQRKDGSVTAYYSTQYSGQAVAAMWAADGPEENTTLFKAQAAGTFGGSVEVDFDSTGKPTALRMRTTLGGQAVAGKRVAFEDEDSGPEANSYVDRTIELPLDTPEARAAAGRLALLAGMPAIPGLPVASLITPGDDWDVVRAALAQGRMWEDDYDFNQNTDVGFDFDAKWIAKVGLEGSSISTTREAKGQRYFDGVGWQQREGCAA